jgi:hypothetical protein
MIITTENWYGNSFRFNYVCAAIKVRYHDVLDREWSNGSFFVISRLPAPDPAPKILHQRLTALQRTHSVNSRIFISMNVEIL